MSENQNVRNIYKKEYAGFFTEDSIGSLEDVINVIALFSALTGEINTKERITVQSDEMESLTNILYRELRAIKSGMHLSGGIFSWHKAEAAGIARKQEVTSN
ncbi:hypothetical protein RCO15_17290 [Escherichia coli]|uniref:Uncharacterized protein n=1 Tax=Escherichia coli TaxID=562 RepID=A0A6N0IS03_ECOLX|nr:MULTISPECIES: hypothetical protein [Escherichia]EFM6085779.1 hypothetical protein [Escherichia coli]EGF4763289.1 hypothetical protein [Escherichia coli]ELF06357.1 hypothetical protein A1YU_04278 [Escherichia coli KTE142]MBA8424007.1 hypothetical protein [Escherichia coli]MBZ9154423.1 hypothetical protein [Escherichia coli]